MSSTSMVLNPQIYFSLSWQWVISASKSNLASIKSRLWEIRARQSNLSLRGLSLRLRSSLGKIVPIKILTTMSSSSSTTNRGWSSRQVTYWRGCKKRLHRDSYQPEWGQVRRVAFLLKKVPQEVRNKSNTLNIPIKKYRPSIFSSSSMQIRL